MLVPLKGRCTIRVDWNTSHHVIRRKVRSSIVQCRHAAALQLQPTHLQQQVYLVALTWDSWFAHLFLSIILSLFLEMLSRNHQVALHLTRVTTWNCFHSSVHNERRPLVAVQNLCRYPCDALKCHRLFVTRVSLTRTNWKELLVGFSAAAKIKARWSLFQEGGRAMSILRFLVSLFPVSKRRMWSDMQESEDSSSQGYYGMHTICTGQ